MLGSVNAWNERRLFFIIHIFLDRIGSSSHADVSSCIYWWRLFIRNQFWLFGVHFYYNFITYSMYLIFLAMGSQGKLSLLLIIIAPCVLCAVICGLCRRKKHPQRCEFWSCALSHRPYSRQVTEQLPLSGSLHSHQLVYPKAGNAASSENHWFFGSSF